MAGSVNDEMHEKIIDELHKVKCTQRWILGFVMLLTVFFMLYLVGLAFGGYKGYLAFQKFMRSDFVTSLQAIAHPGKTLEKGGKALEKGVEKGVGGAADAIKDLFN